MVFQIMLRCCLHNGIVSGVLCGLPSSLPVTTVVSGGGDGTIISEIFAILSLCASSTNKDLQPEGNAKSRVANPSVLVLHSCLILATVAQCFKSSGRNSALFEVLDEDVNLSFAFQVIVVAAADTLLFFLC